MREGDSRCDRMLREAGCSPKAIAHCHAVRDLASSFVDRYGVIDSGLVTGGALLHDIGRGMTHSLHHAVRGAAYCRDLGLPEDVVRIVERHIGAGLSADECSLLRLPPVNCMPQTLEEKIVANADNLVKGSHEISIYNRLESSLSLDRRIRHRIYRLWLFCEQIGGCSR